MALIINCDYCKRKDEITPTYFTQTYQGYKYFPDIYKIACNECQTDALSDHIEIKKRLRKVFMDTKRQSDSLLN